MSLLDVGRQCETCSLVDFLPFTCPSCAGVFCKDHVHTHGCVTATSDGAAGPSRKRIRGTCARQGCSAETIESIGGLEVDGEGAKGDHIARQVRCRGCGSAYCVTHRAQDAHACPAPREETARHDAGIARRAHAQEVLARTMPDQAGKARLTMPKQVDRTRSTPTRDPDVLPPSVIVEREEEVARAAGASAPPPPTALAPASAGPSAAASAWTDSPAYRKLHKLHCVKIRSLSKPLDPRIPRDQSRAVEWTVDVAGDHVKAWSALEKFKPDAAAAAVGERKAERIWVPETMPGGKLLDTLVAISKLGANGEPLSILCLSLQPGPQRALPVALDCATSCGSQLQHGDVLVLVRGWTSP